MIALYARQSVERENSVSIQTQLAYCRTALGPDVPEEELVCYTDEGWSGGTTNRPAFAKLMADIAQGRIQKVVTYKLDRISRSLSDFVGILAQFQAHYVEFVSSQECFDTASLYGDLILKILMVFAEFERTSIINRVRDAYAKRTDMGLYMGGRRPYGFCLQDTVEGGIPTKAYVPIPEEAAVVQFLFAQYAQPNMTLYKLLDRLSENTAVSGTSRSWSTAKLRAILINPLYAAADAALYQYFDSHRVRMVDGPAVYDGTRAARLYGRSTHDRTLPDWSDMKLVLLRHAGLVPSAVWLACQHKLAANKQAGNSLSNQTSRLAGLVVCGRCGRTMTTIKSRRKDETCRRFFQCTGHTHAQSCPGIGLPIYAEDLEALANRHIAARLHGMGELLVPQMPTTSDPAAPLRTRMQEIQCQQRQLGELLLSPAMSPELLAIANRQAASLAEDRYRVEAALREHARQDAAHAPRFRLASLWDTASFDQRKAVARLLLAGVVIQPGGGCTFLWQTSVAPP